MGMEMADGRMGAANAAPLPLDLIMFIKTIAFAAAAAAALNVTTSNSLSSSVASQTLSKTLGAACSLSFRVGRRCRLAHPEHGRSRASA